MDKGIRPAMIAAFNAALPTRVNTREGNTVFRKTVMAGIMEDFGITLASAATHYNHAFIEAKKDPLKAELLAGLGRPEDKKGGRKPKPKTEAAPAAASVIPNPNLLANMLAAIPAPKAAEEVAQPDFETVEQYKARMTAELASTAEEAAPVQKYSVCKVSDKSIVCSDLSLDEANAMIAKAAAAKKAKLELVA